MADIFGIDSTVGKPSFVKGGSGAVFEAGGKVGLVQNWNVSYQLNVQQIYECGSNKVYFAAPTPQGTATFARIVANGRFGFNNFKVCNPQSMAIVAKDGACATNGVSLTLTGAVRTSVGWSGQAQNAYVDEQVGFTFVSASMS